MSPKEIVDAYAKAKRDWHAKPSDMRLHDAWVAAWRVMADGAAISWAKGDPSSKEWEREMSRLAEAA